MTAVRTGRWRRVVLLVLAAAGRWQRVVLLVRLVLAAAGCWLLFFIAFQQQTSDDLWQQQQRASRSEGLYRGQTISQLWARNLPEQAWFSSLQCRHFITRFTRDNCLEVVRLASFPRSGNTWTRYLLESATGLFTSAGGPTYFQYRNAAMGRKSTTKESTTKRSSHTELSRMGFAGDMSSWTQGNTIVSKTHSLPEPWKIADIDRLPSDTAPFAPNSTRRAILLIRDPLQACISMMYFTHTQSVLHKGEARAELFQGPEWEQFVNFFARHWFAINVQWLEATNATHIVMYERLVRDPMHELRGMLRFLEVEPDPARMECVRLHLEGRAHNKRHSVVPDNTTYPLPLRGLVWSQIHALNLHLKDKGYRELPLEQYSFADQFMDIGI